MEKKVDYYYSLYKNHTTIGEQNINIIMNGNIEKIYVELLLMGKKIEVDIKYIDGKLEGYAKKISEAGLIKEEKLYMIRKNEYSFYQYGKEGIITSGKPLAIYEKEVLLPNEIPEKVFSEKTIISLESLSTYKIKYFPMENGAYKIYMPERMMVEYGENYTFMYSLNLENVVETKLINSICTLY